MLQDTGLIVSFCLGLALCPQVQSLLEGCELPDLPAGLLLPEDMALRNLPPLRTAHRRFNFDADRLLLSALEEVRNLLPTTSAKFVICGSKSGFLGWGRTPTCRLGASFRLQIYLDRCLCKHVLLLVFSFHFSSLG